MENKKRISNYIFPKKEFEDRIYKRWEEKNILLLKLTRVKSHIQ